MRIHQFFGWLMVFIVLLACTPTGWAAESDSAPSLSVLGQEPTALELVPGQPALEPKSVMLVELGTGKVLYAKNADNRIYPASVTKIMTVLLAVEAIERGEFVMEDPVTPTEAINYNLRADGSSANIRPGETMPLGDLLYCAMLVSANEACNVIAEYIAGDIHMFIARMNSRAKELGCTGTQFNNTHGLPDEAHYTTARDLFLITQEAVSHPLFSRLCNTTEMVVPATNLSDVRSLSSTNALINASRYEGAFYYEGAAGVKTGTTGAAGYCLISTATRGGMTLLGVVMGAGAAREEDGTLRHGSFEGTANLYDWGFENYAYREVLSAQTSAAQLEVTVGHAEQVDLLPSRTVTALLPTWLDMEEIEWELELTGREGEEALEAPVLAGEVLGTLTLRWGEEVLATVELLAAADVERLSFFERLTIADFLRAALILLAIAIVGYIVLVIRAMRIRARRRAARRAAGYGRSDAGRRDQVGAGGPRRS